MQRYTFPRGYSSFLSQKTGRAGVIERLDSLMQRCGCVYFTQDKPENEVICVNITQDSLWVMNFTIYLQKTEGVVNPWNRVDINGRNQTVAEEIKRHSETLSVALFLLRWWYALYKAKTADRRS